MRIQRLRGLAGALVARLVVVLLFAELVLWGGDRPVVSLAFATMELLGLALLLLLAPWARHALANLPRLDVIGAIFLTLLLWTALQAIPLPWLVPSGWVDVPGQRSISLAPFSSLTEILELAGLGALFVISVAVARDDDRAHAAWNTFGVLAALFLAASIWAYATRTDADAKFTAFLINANTAATTLAIFVVAGWTAILRAVMSLHSEALTAQKLSSLLRTAAPWAALVLLSFAGLSLTGSRGGAGACFFGLLACTVVMAWSERRKRRTLYVILGASGAIVLLFGALVLSSGTVAARLALTDAALANRGTIIGIYLEELPRLPWTGFGLGTFRHFNNLLVEPGERGVLWNLGALHNVYLQWIYEAGYVGAALMFGLVGYILVTIAQGLDRRRFGRTWIVGSLAISAVVLSHGVIDYALQLPAIAGVWTFALGMGFGVSRPSSR